MDRKRCVHKHTGKELYIVSLPLPKQDCEVLQNPEIVKVRWMEDHGWYEGYINVHNVKMVVD
jgi:hypothetical protein